MAEEAKVAVPELEKAEIPWVVAYLREDIQDLRSEIRELRREMDRRFELVDERLDTLHREMRIQLQWMVGTTVAVGGLIVAALKLLP